MKAFFALDCKGNVKSVMVSERVISDDVGIQIEVSEHQAEQIHKFELYFDNNVPKLRLKDGETFFEVEETEEEKEIRELEERLQQLKAE